MKLFSIKSALLASLILLLGGLSHADEKASTLPLCYAVGSHGGISGWFVVYKGNEAMTGTLAGPDEAALQRDKLISAGLCQLGWYPCEIQGGVGHWSWLVMGGVPVEQEPSLDNAIEDLKKFKRLQLCAP